VKPICERAAVSLVSGLVFSRGPAKGATERKQVEIRSKSSEWFSLVTREQQFSLDLPKEQQTRSWSRFEARGRACSIRSIRQHTSHTHTHTHTHKEARGRACSIRSIRQHTWHTHTHTHTHTHSHTHTKKQEAVPAAGDSIRQHTSAYVTRHTHTQTHKHTHTHTHTHTHITSHQTPTPIPHTHTTHPHPHPHTPAQAHIAVCLARRVGSLE
jgi:hypothetical protein